MIITIDEAIAYAREVSSGKFDDRVHCTRCSEFYEHLEELLEELKDYRDKNKMVVRIDCVNSDEFKDILVKTAKEQYNKAIDDFVKEICKMFVQSENNGNYRFYAVEVKQAIADLAEQLKTGVKE